ncbi:IPT/TIG domain-containing protein [Rugamonas sp. CCM 8940]|uniref:IPT/TIG domain-containing protein n=1 Tax=Rugamonas sp. CCM 8940 TaxID=2765359 RepID=UPI0018F41C99|nr:IPT/TIG domain-containing protein [Rugamonas sp. CCM 8940]MBJ7313416.1 IPT/TIG domain-containing protein [Rugamonas sp. CCM 8940]
MTDICKVMIRIVWMLAAISLATVLPAYGLGSRAVTYGYDELGRLVGVTDPSGNSATYRYDAVGNILSITRSAADQPAIAEFTPNGGPAGTKVTIFGSGFSDTPSQNIVKFNQVAATVVSASSTKIVTAVPVGATTGTISVTTPTASVTSDLAFNVGVNKAPTIARFTPSIGVAGTQVSIEGGNFDSVANHVKFNGVSAAVRSVTANNIIAAVPQQVSSGKISVATAYGGAVSDVDFFVVPTPYSAADIQVTDRLSIGESKTVVFSTPGKKGLVLFDGTAGQKVSLSLTSVPLISVMVKILRPDGAVLPMTSISPAGFMDALTLPVTGTYTILIVPVANAMGSITMRMDAFADVSGSIVIDGPAVDVQIAKPGQNGSLAFSGAAGQRFSMRLAKVALTNGGDVSITVVKPDGTTLSSSFSPPGSGTFVDAQILPVTGTYLIKLNPSGNSVGGMAVQLFSTPDVVAVIAPDGVPMTVTTTKPGQNAVLTFSAIAGQRVSLRLSKVALVNGVSAKLSILKPDGTTLVPVSLISSGIYVDAQTLPLTGVYAIKFDPQGEAVGSATAQLYGLPDDVATGMAIDGPAVTVTTIKPGQNAGLTFSGTAGQRVSLQLSKVALTNGSYVDVAIRKPDGSTLAPGIPVSVNGAFVDAQALPVTGNYTIELNPRGEAMGSVTAQLYGVPEEDAKSMVIDGPAVTVTSTKPGQNASLTFSAAAGQRVSLQLSKLLLLNGTNVDISLLKPDGSTLASSIMTLLSGTFIDAKVLPVAGTYTIKLNPRDLVVGSVTLQLYDVSQDVAAGIDVGGSAVAVAITKPGQNAGLSFVGIAGQKTTLHIAASTLGCPTISLRKPDGTVLISQIVCGAVFNLPSQILPTSGAYMIGIDPSGANTGKASVAISSP